MKVCPTCNQVYDHRLSLCPSDATPLELLREWQQGEVVAQTFQIIEKIGHGSMGSVFKSEHITSGEIHVLKAIRRQLGVHESTVEALRRYIRQTSLLWHPNAVRTESLERSQDGTLFIVMEYATGTALRSLIRSRGPLPAHLVAEIVVQICSALESAHSLGIIHRDIKPGNVLVTERGASSVRVKVLEFGMASVREVAAASGTEVGGVVKTDKGPVVGTLEYMSPEQAMGTAGDLLDGRSDLYSLGVLAYEALTGDVPINAQDPERFLLYHLPMQTREWIFDGVMRALQKSLQSRYQSASEMASAFREIAEHCLREARTRNAPYGGAEGVSFGGSFQPSARPPMESQPWDRWAEYNGPSSRGIVPAPRAEGGSPKGTRMARGETASTEATLDEIRRSWSYVDVGSSEKSGTRRRLRFVLPVVGVVAIGILGFHWAYQRALVPSSLPTGEVTKPKAEVPDVSPEPDARPSLREIIPPAKAAEAAPIQLDSRGAPARGGAAQAGVVGARSAPKVAPSGRESRRTQGTQPAVAGPARVPRARVSPDGTKPGTGSSNISAAQRALLQEKLVIGWFFVERKDYGAAIESFQEALKIDPSNPEARAGLRVAIHARENPNIEVLPSSRGASEGNSGKRQP